MHSATDKDQPLRNIVATLLSLAILAEYAGRRSRAVRALVFLFLHHAEGVAREFIAAQTLLPASVALPLEGSDSGPAGLSGLAARFRLLADALQSVLGEPARYASIGSFGERPFQPILNAQSRLRGLDRDTALVTTRCTKQPNDTS